MANCQQLLMKDNNLEQINWFPGHMKKATDQIIKKVDHVDLFIEVVDARCVKTSSNEELRKLAKNKPILTIALKKDLSSANPSDYPEILFGSIKDKSLRNTVLNKLYEIVNEKMQKLKQKGLINPKFLVMIVGLPNVGKSSLINLLKNKKMAVAKNQPGVTKNQQLISINEHFDLIDTPGILFKKISNLTSAYKLALINCIKKEVLPLEKVLEFGYQEFNSQNQKALSEYYDISETNDFFSFRDLVCQRYQYILNKEELDIARFDEAVFNDFSLGKISKINYDK